MEKCLVKMFKSVVSDNSLPIFNKVKISLPQRNISLMIKSKEANKVCLTTEGNSKLLLNNSEVQQPYFVPISDTTIVITNDAGDGKLIVDGAVYVDTFGLYTAADYIANEYELNQLVTATNFHFANNVFIKNTEGNYIYILTSNLKVNNSAITHFIAPLKGNINELGTNIFASCDKVSFAGINGKPVLSGNVTQFNFSNATELTLSDTNLSGDIKDLSVGSGLTKLTFFRTLMTGDIVNLVDTLINAGVSSGVAINYISPTDLVRFNGKQVTGSALILYWETSSKIYITTSNDKVLCYGYTDTEINTKTSTGGIWYGKTIIKVDN